MALAIKKNNAPITILQTDEPGFQVETGLDSIHLVELAELKKHEDEMQVETGTEAKKSKKKLWTIISNNTHLQESMKRC